MDSLEKYEFDIMFLIVVGIILSLCEGYANAYYPEIDPPI